MRTGLAGALTVTVITLSAAMAGCGSGAPVPPPSPPPDAGPVTSARSDLAARATAAKGLVAVSVYQLTTPAGRDRTVMVVRAEDGGWRVDVAGGALGGAADIAIARTGDGLFQCVLAGAEGAGPACVRVDQLTPDIDPRVQRVFIDWLEVLTDRAAAIAVTAAEPPPEVAGACYAVEPSAASLAAPLDAGVYCYQTDGTLTGAELELGTLTLVSTGEAAPPAIELPGPVVDGEPLPTESPPAPSPSSAASPGPAPVPGP